MRKTFHSCLVPYLVYSTVFTVVNLAVYRDMEVLRSNLTDTFILGRGSCNVLWFLLSLFFVENIYQLFTKTTRKPIWAAALLMILSVILRLLGVPNALFLLSSAQALFFYAMGASYCTPPLRAALEKIFSAVSLALCCVVHTFSFILCYKLTEQKLDLSDAKLGAFPISLLTALAGIGMLLIFSWYFQKCSRFLKKPLMFIGANTIFFFPLTAYLPGLLQDILAMAGISYIGAKGKLLLKAAAFLLSYLIVLLYRTAIKAKQNKIQIGE